MHHFDTWGFTPFLSKTCRSRHERLFVAVARLTFTERTTMPNYFYTDSNGQKQGLVSDDQLQALAAQGVINANTPLETEGGHKGTAGQIPGLKFNTAPPPSAQTMKEKSRTEQSVVSIAMSVKSWLLDFAFRDLRLPIINLWACRILYVICCVAAILGGIAVLGTVYDTMSGFGDWLMVNLIILPLTVIGVALSIIAARLLCELYIIAFDWIVETTKAARLYNENNKEEK